MDKPIGLGVGVPTQTIKDQVAAVETLQPAWWYDWGCANIGQPGYVPMMYRHAHFPVVSQIKQHGGFWLGPNEPELGSQANMTPDECADDVLKAIRHGADMAWPAILLTPRSTWSLQWFERFAKLWQGPRPMVLAVHIYGVRGGTEWNELFEKWYQFLRLLGLDDLPTIVTETNFDHGDESDQLGLLRYLAWRLTKDERMQAVAWFAAYWPRHHSASLLDGYGNPTALGKAFKALQEQGA